MKTNIILLGLIGIQVFTVKMINAHELTVNRLSSRYTLTNLDVLQHIQARITNATNNAFIDGNTKNLDAIEEELNLNKSADKHLIQYWIAYINYYKTIVGMKTGNMELSKSANKKGIKILDAIKQKTADDYALLVLLKGLSFSFSSGMEAPMISLSIRKNIKRGFNLDSANFRLYYAQGSNDFYTPKQYGGGKKVEKLLTKAIELPEKNVKAGQPTWGKEESYDLLIRFYLAEGKKEKAKVYFDKAKQLFPKSYIVREHQNEF